MFHGLVPVRAIETVGKVEGKHIFPPPVIAAVGFAVPIQVYAVAVELLQPDPLGFVLIQMVFVPATAVIVGTVERNPAVALVVLYSKFCVPVPPEPRTGFIKVRLVPAHTVVVAGDIVAVGGKGSSRTVITLAIELAIFEQASVTTTL